MVYVGFKTTDKKINDWLNPQPNKSGAVKDAIRAYINGETEDVEPKKVIMPEVTLIE